jgi:hypothetical protein
MKIQFFPHVPGEISDKSEIDYTFEPFKVQHLHMIFDFRPDSFCTCFPVYFISEKLLNDFKNLNVTGFINPILITHEQNEQSPIKNIDCNFFMIDILNDQINDLSLVEDSLFISERVKVILDGHNLRFGEFKITQ